MHSKCLFLLLIFTSLIVNGQSTNDRSNIEIKRSKFIAKANKALATKFKKSFVSIEGSDIFVQTQSARDLLIAENIELTPAYIIAMNRIIQNPIEFDLFIERNVKKMRLNKGFIEQLSSLGFKYYRFRGLANGKLYSSSVFILKQ